MTINIMLSRLVVAPIKRIAALSDEISRGNLDLPEFKKAAPTKFGICKLPSTACAGA
jgi:hypothetical protein